MAFIDNPRHVRYRRSARTGDVGSPANWTGAPRQLREAGGAVYERDVVWRRRLVVIVLILAVCCAATLAAVA
jgi:hypothetical protein